MSFTPISWPTDTTVQLCRVPWDGNYRDVVRFPSESARRAYFEGLGGSSVKLEKMTYIKPGEPIYINTPYSQAYTMNYCVVKNPSLPVPGEVTPPTLYYFVTGVAFVAPNTTALTVELDVWQTYILGVKFGRCFLDQGHWALDMAYYYATESGGGYAPYGLEQYATIAESLDIGNEYRIAVQHWHSLEDESENPWVVIFAATTDLSAEWGTMDAPSLKTSNGGNYDGMASGMSYWAVDGSDAPRLFEQLRNAPWVSKGILSATLFPKRLINDFRYDAQIGTVRARDLNNLLNTPSARYFSERPMNDVMEALPDRYSYLVKFATYPYSVIELTAFNGSNVLLKPEMCWTPTLWFNIAATFPAPFTRLCVFPDKYGQAANNEVSQEHTYRDSTNTERQRLAINGSGLDSALWISDFPQFALTNDSYVNYMASQVHTRAYNYESAGWGLARSRAQNELSLENSMTQYDLADRNMMIQNAQDVVNAGAGFIGNLASGNFGGAAVSLIGGGADILGGNVQFQNTQEVNRGIATSNYEMAEYAAQGDYNNTIKGIDAAVQDAQLLAPSVVGQQGGNGFNVANGLFGVEYRVKVPDKSHIRAIGEYWLRYGYEYHAFMTPPNDLKAMTRATYWKVKECYITSAQADEGAKQAIRGIMEKGVTVYENPNDIGRLDFADNKPISR